MTATEVSVEEGNYASSWIPLVSRKFKDVAILNFSLWTSLMKDCWPRTIFTA